MIDFRKVASFYKRAGYQWTFKDGRRNPTAKEIESTVALAIETLKDEPDHAQLEVGRLIVQKNDGFYDIYVQMGEIPIV